MNAIFLGQLFLCQKNWWVVLRLLLSPVVMLDAMKIGSPLKVEGEGAITKVKGKNGEVKVSW